MIRVVCEEDRWGDHMSFPGRDEEPIRALGLLFENELWWAADIVDCCATRLVVRTSLLPHHVYTTTFEGPEEEMRALTGIAYHCLVGSAEREGAVRTATELLEEHLGFYDGDAPFVTAEERLLSVEARMRAACLTMAGTTDPDLFERGMRLPVRELIAAFRLVAEGECSLDEALN